MINIPDDLYYPVLIWLVREYGFETVPARWSLGESTFTGHATVSIPDSEDRLAFKLRFSL